MFTLPSRYVSARLTATWWCKDSANHALKLYVVDVVNLWNLGGCDATPTPAPSGTIESLCGITLPLNSLFLKGIPVSTLERFQVDARLIA